MSILQGEGGTGVADDRPLTDQEYKLLQRLLSDPFSLPIQFKSWLVSFLEASDMNLPISAINGLTAILGVAGVGAGVLGVLPAGLVLPFGGLSAPTGALLCDGAAYLNTNYPRLYAEIGTTYGAPDGTSFNVPDLRGRVPVGVGPHADVAALGLHEGAALPDRGPKHGHSHSLAQTYQDKFLITDAGSTDASGGDYPMIPFSGGDDGAIPVGGSIGPAGTPLDSPAFISINFIIVA